MYLCFQFYINYCLSFQFNEEYINSLIKSFLAVPNNKFNFTVLIFVLNAPSF
jgi:hypothetical protein